MGLLTIDDFTVALEKAIDEIPPRFLSQLNGGINLRQGSKRQGERYVLGEYVEEKNGACYIVLYYGSFEYVFSEGTAQTWQEEIVRTVREGVQHHLESRAERTKLPKVKLGIWQDPAKKIRRIY